MRGANIAKYVKPIAPQNICEKKYDGIVNAKCSKKPARGRNIKIL